MERVAEFEKSETKESIAAWSRETFGPATDLRVAVRAQEECVELLRALTTDQPVEKVAEEIADVVIVLARIDRAAFVWEEPDGAFPAIQNAAQASVRLAEFITAQASVRLAEFITFEAEIPDISTYPLTRALFYLRCTAIALGVDLWAEVEKKMKINRARVWKRDGSGCAYHLKHTETAEGHSVTYVPGSIAHSDGL